MNMEGIIDEKALSELLETVGGDTEFLAELVGDFFEDTDQQLKLIHEAIVAGDSESLRRAAHSLKGNCASFGALDMRDLCKKLEDLGKEGQLAGAEALTEKIEAEYKRVHAALDARMSS